MGAEIRPGERRIVSSESYRFKECTTDRNVLFYLRRSGDFQIRVSTVSVRVALENPIEVFGFDRCTAPVYLLEIVRSVLTSEKLEGPIWSKTSYDETFKGTDYDVSRFLRRLIEVN